ncbi:hypothetical protein AFLA70_523g000531 [Aspergillus flavus AF70]|nr:hypothetical protein AFLA70_523g000531 [Aspergillus flavus AF70]
MSFVTNSYSDLLLPLRIVSHDDFATVDCTGLPLPLLGNKSWQNPAFSLGRCMRLPHCVLLQRGPNDMVAPLTSFCTPLGACYFGLATINDGSRSHRSSCRPDDVLRDGASWFPVPTGSIFNCPY